MKGQSKLPMRCIEFPKIIVLNQCTLLTRHPRLSRGPDAVSWYGPPLLLNSLLSLCWNFADREPLAFQWISSTRLCMGATVFLQILRVLLCSSKYCGYYCATLECLATVLQQRPDIHCKKRWAIFPSPAGMSQTKLSLEGNNLSPCQGVVGLGTSQLRTGKPITFFYSVLCTGTTVLPGSTVVHTTATLLYTEPVFVNGYGAQELIPRNRFRQPM
jgi:hypothetical protein